MSKGRKSKPRSERHDPAGRGSITTIEERPSQGPNSESPLVAHPPRRNVALLVTSIVLLALWLVILVWLAATA